MVFMRLVAALIADSTRQQLQCVGCDKEFHWPFGGTLVALCDTGWSLLGMLVFELVALVQRITVVPNAKTRLPSVAMNLISSADVRAAPVTGDKAP